MSSRMTQDDLFSVLEPQFPNLSSGVLICPSLGSVRVPSCPQSLQKHLASWALANSKCPTLVPLVHHSDLEWEVTGLQMPLARLYHRGQDTVTFSKLQAGSSCGWSAEDRQGRDWENVESLLRLEGWAQRWRPGSPPCPSLGLSFPISKKKGHWDC